MSSDPPNRHLLDTDPQRPIAAAFGAPDDQAAELGYDDAGLISEYLGGHQAAYGELVRRHQIALFRLLLGLLADEDLAEEACQEVFILAERRLAELDDRGAYYHWLLSLAREVSAKFNERRASVDTTQPLSADPRDRLRHEIHAVLQQLSPDLRLVLVLVELRGAPDLDVAAALGCPPAEVPSMVAEARAEFERILGARAGPPTPDRTDPRPSHHSAPRLSPDQRLGPYTILRPIAEGGMGAVYLAEDDRSGARVALKTVLPGLVRDDLSLRRFQREVEAIKRSAHENFVQILDHGRQGEIPYIVMELLEGCTIEQIFVRGRPFDPTRALALIRGVLRGLIHAHSAGVIHRDLKLANVFVLDPGGEAERIKILDLGLAKILQDDEAVAATMLTEQGMIFGTPATMAPEQALGEEVDHRADLYAVAVMLFQLLAGRLPFESASASALLVMHVSSPPPPLAELAPHLAGSGLPELVERGLAKARDDRFQSAAELLAALDRCALRPLPPPGDTLPSILHDLRGAPPPTQPSGALTPVPAPPPPDRAHRRAAILLLVLAAALVGLALLGSARDAL